MKKKVAIFLLSLVMALVPATACCATGRDTALKRLGLPEKFEFDEHTNSLIDFFGCKMQIPYTWTKGPTLSSDSDALLYYAEETEKVSFIATCYEDMSGDYEWICENEDIFIDAVSGSFDDFDIIEKTPKNTWDSKAFSFSFEGSSEELDVVGDVAVYADQATGNLFVFYYYNQREAEYSHFRDFYKVLGTVGYVEPETESETEREATLEDLNALSQALSYLSHSDFSYSGLVDQLEYEGYSQEACIYAADHCGADWYEQALKSAKSYLSHSHFSYSGLVDQLEYEGFTSDEANYGVGNCGADWYEQAAKTAESYLSHSSFSRQGLLDQLLYEGFTHKQAEYGLSAVGY